MNKGMRRLCVAIIMMTTEDILAEEVCHPGDGPYASIGVGISKIQSWKRSAMQEDTHFHTNPGFRVAIGSQFSIFRVEFEPSYSRAHYTTGSSSGHLNLISTLGNFYLGLPFEGHFATYPVAPYVAGGVGFSSVRANFNPLQVQNQGHSTVLSYQGIAGVRFALNDKVGLNVEYRYFSTEKLNYTGRRIESHSANLGLTYRF